MLRLSQRVAEQNEAPPTTLRDLPLDVLVSIVIQCGSYNWARKTVPLVCKEWRDLYDSRQASPLHKNLDLDLTAHRAPSVLAWARRHAEDVSMLSVDQSPGAPIRDFTVENLAELVSILGSHLTGIWMIGCGALLGERFWATMRDVVVPAHRLEKLVVAGIRAPIPDSVSESLGRCTSLKALGMQCARETPLEAARNDAAGTRWGFSRFPESLVALTGLQRLVLHSHRGVASLPSGISNLKNLIELTAYGCSFRSLPAELGALSALTSLNVGNERLGAAPEAEAFPPALGGMKALRELGLSFCRIGTVSSFVGEFRSLKKLNLGTNNLGLAGAPNHGFPAPFPEMRALTELDLSRNSLSAVPPAVLSSMSGLRRLELSGNRLRELPSDLGRRLPRLEKISLRSNFFSALPLAALAGATSLEEIDAGYNRQLQVEEPLDSLLESFPRLRKVTMRKISGSWSTRSRAHLADFASRLRARNPEAEVEF